MPALLVQLARASAAELQGASATHAEQRAQVRSQQAQLQQMATERERQAGIVMHSLPLAALKGFTASWAARSATCRSAGAG